MRQISATFQSTRLLQDAPCRARVSRSWAISALSHARPSGSSQPACSGRSVSTRRATSPSTTAGRPSTMKSHFQPASPSQPSSRSSASEAGAPIRIATGAAIMNSAPLFARSRAGIQYVR